MSTLTITLTEEQVDQYDLHVDSLTLDQLVDKIKTEVAREALRKCQSIAEENGLADLTPEEINAEIQAVREAENRR